MDNRMEVLLMCSPFKHVITSTLAKIKEEYGLKKVDVEVLYYLSICKEQNTPTDIYRRLMLNKGHISQALECLTEHGLIEARPDERDGRCTHYLVRPEAANIIRLIRDLQLDMERQLLKDISEEEMFSSSFHIMLAAVTRYAIGLIYISEKTNQEKEVERLEKMILREFTREK